MCGKLGDLSSPDGVLLDPGPSGRIFMSDDRIFSFEWQRWGLYDSSSHEILATGVSDCGAPAPCTAYAEMRGGTFANTNGPSVIELRSAVDGGLLVTIPEGTPDRTFGLAEDGSFLWVATVTYLRIYDLTGALLYEEPGNAAASKIYATDNEVRVLNAQLHIIDVSLGAVVADIPYLGTDPAWFVDGNHFFTHVGSVYRVYSANGVQEALMTSAGYPRGSGEYFWTSQMFGAVNVYAISDPTTPLVTVPPSFLGRGVGAGRYLAVLPDTHAFPVEMLLFDLSAPTLAEVSVAVASAPDDFVASPDGRWAIAARDGYAIYESEDLANPLSCGAIDSIDGSPGGVVAISTSGGGILLFDVSPDPQIFLGSIDYPSAEVAVGGDGTWVAALRRFNNADSELRIFDVATKMEIATLGGPIGFHDIVAATSGDRLAWATGGDYCFESDGFVSGLDLATVDEFPSACLLALSPEGTRVAVSGTKEESWLASCTIYEGTTLVGAAEGLPRAWLNETELLTNRFLSSSPSDDTWIYDPAGAPLGAPPIPNAPHVGVIDQDTIYSQLQGAVYDVATGAVLWEDDSPYMAVGAPAAGRVVYSDWASGIRSVAY